MRSCYINIISEIARVRMPLTLVCMSLSPVTKACTEPTKRFFVTAMKYHDLNAVSGVLLEADGTVLIYAAKMQVVV